MLTSVRYLVVAENRPDVLSRVVMLLHRLAVPIDMLIVKRSPKTSTLELTLEAQVIVGQDQRIADNLMKLVQVMSVEICRPRKRLQSTQRNSLRRKTR